MMKDCLMSGPNKNIYNTILGILMFREYHGEKEEIYKPKDTTYTLIDCLPYITGVLLS